MKLKKEGREGGRGKKHKERGAREKESDRQKAKTYQHSVKLASRIIPSTTFLKSPDSQS